MTRQKPARAEARRHELAWPTFLWPVCALLLIALLWTFSLRQLERDREASVEQSLQRAASLSRAYGAHLERRIEQLDRMLLRLKYEWEDPEVRLSLERQRDRGLFPGEGLLHVSVLDRAGQVITSTEDEDVRRARADPDFFLHHMTDNRSGLLITEMHPGPYSPNTVVRFSRRLSTPDGSFAGVVVVAVEPEYLASFYDQALLTALDFITLKRLDGTVLANRSGGGRPEEVYSLDRQEFRSRTGVSRAPGNVFRDQEPRLVAWNTLGDYPLVAVAALSESEALAENRAAVRRTFTTAGTASVFLFLFSIAGMTLSARMAWRRRQAEEIKRTYRLAVDAAREGFYILRPLHGDTGEAEDFQFEDCNERAAAMLGYARASLLGIRLSDLYQGPAFEKRRDLLRRALKQGYYEEEERIGPDSLLKATWVHRRVVHSGPGVAVTLRDISDVHAHREALAAMANIDTVTGLPNRHWLGNFLPRALEQARSSKTSVAVLVIDLDDFRNINDTLGHAVGDELLKAAALRLKALVRATDHVVRLGGDEFTIVLQQVQHIEDVVRVARMIVNTLSEPFALNMAHSHSAQASIGVAVFPDDGEDGPSLLKHADVAMYAAKAGGKGRYHFYHTHLSDTLALRIAREHALREAIERDQFVLHYQPRVDSTTGRLLSVEALVRWMHPERGLVPPVEFIQVAEETGLILSLGRMVIEKACAQIARWKADGLPVVPVSVNVSALQFNNGNVKDVLQACMEKYGVEPDLIGVELTESCMAGDDARVAGELDGLRALGVKLLVDDFGTGYSSLSQLQRLNVDILKVDRAFTVTLADSEEGKALFKAIVSMADALDIGIVAEGVETTEQLQVLRSLACGEVQGHLVSQPVPAADMAKLMIRRFLFVADPETAMTPA